MTQDVQRGPLTCVWRRKCRVRHLAPPLQHVSGSGCCSRCRKPGLAQPALTVLVLRLQVWHRGVVGLASPGASQTSVVPVSSRGAPLCTPAVSLGPNFLSSRGRQPCWTKPP